MSLSEYTVDNIVILFSPLLSLSLCFSFLPQLLSPFQFKYSFRNSYTWTKKATNILSTSCWPTLVSSYHLPFCSWWLSTKTVSIVYLNKFLISLWWLIIIIIINYWVFSVCSVLISVYVWFVLYIYNYVQIKLWFECHCLFVYRQDCGCGPLNGGHAENVGCRGARQL